VINRVDQHSNCVQQLDQQYLMYREACLATTGALPGSDAMMTCASAKARSKSALSPGRMLRIATSRIIVIFPLLTPRAHPFN
jgi:hypothetical protein